MKKSQQLTEEQALITLDKIYDLVLNGIPKVSKPIEEFARDYSSKYKGEHAVKTMMKNQIIKCTATGVATGFGGFALMPLTIPADLSSSLYMQMRMIACTAHLNGYDVHSDQVRTMIWACLVGLSVNNILKQFGVKAGVKIAQSAVKKVPGKVLIAINKKIGFRFITKFGSKGVVNLGKLIPGVGAAISGGLNLAETKIIANRAYKFFVEGDFSDGEIIDVEYEDIEDDEVEENACNDASEEDIVIGDE